MTPFVAGPFRRWDCALANRLGSAVALLLCSGVALTVAPQARAARAQPPPGLVLSPSRVETVASPGLRLGPFSLLNQTSTGYGVRVFPVLLAQDRQGGITVGDEGPSLRRARRFLGSTATAFDLPPGAEHSATGVVKRIPRSGGLYGGLLFEARPKRTQRQQIISVLRLNASVWLDPPLDRRRVRIDAARIHAEQAGKGRIRLVVPVTNRGNAYLGAHGRVRVLDPGGDVRAAARLSRARILPGATVELSGIIDERLPPGTYPLEATLRMAGETAATRGTMVLGGVSAVEFRSAALGDFPAPTAYEGDPVEVRASYRNTGNVSFAPRAEVRIRPVHRGVAGKVAGTQPLVAAATDPGDTGEVSGSIELPGEAQSYELELDSLTVSVTPQAKPALATRVSEWITGNAILLVLALGAALVALTAAALRYRRRLGAIAPGRGGRPEPEAAPGARSAAPKPQPAATRRRRPAPRGRTDGTVALSTASFEDLRELGMSMTQANRILRYREARGGYSSVEELDEVPGIPEHLRAELKRRLTV